MPRTQVTLDKEALQSAGKWIGVVSGAGVPAATYYASYAPPLFPGISWITAAVAAAILVIARAWRFEPQRLRDKLPPFMRSAATLIAISVGLLIVYTLVFQFTTVAVRPTGEERLQIGFGMADWTLTPEGRRWKADQPTITPVEMLKNEQFNVQKVYTQQSIYGAGAALIVLYFLAFIIWSLGFALLSPSNAAARGRRSWI